VRSNMRRGMTVSRARRNRRGQMGWIYRKRWQRRVALKKRLIQAAIDALVAGEVQRLFDITSDDNLQIRSARRDDGRPS
jgi:hypothetical protein